MLSFAAAAGFAFGAIFLAEFGDKSQLLILALATRHAWRPVVLGLVIAAALVQGASVLVGAAAGELLAPTVVGTLSGITFLAVAAWIVRGEDSGKEASAIRLPRPSGWAVAGAVAAAFVLSELGDKTMLATFAIAASQGALPTWIGSTAGEVAANLVAVVVGRQAGTRLSPGLIRFGSAGLFALTGTVVLAGALAT